MSLLNRGRKLFYLAGVVLLGGCVVIIGVISVTQKSHLPYRRIDKLKMAMHCYVRSCRSLLWPAYCMASFALAASQWSWEPERPRVLIVLV